VVIDYYLGAVEALKAPFTSVRAVTVSGLRRFGTRGAQPVVIGTAAKSNPTPNEPVAKYHLPYWAATLLLLFPLFAGLAAIAAFWYFGVTLPGHLGGGPSAAP
jgi:hypothetical protein